MCRRHPRTTTTPTHGPDCPCTRPPGATAASGRTNSAVGRPRAAQPARDPGLRTHPGSDPATAVPSSTRGVDNSHDQAGGPDDPHLALLTTRDDGRRLAGPGAARSSMADEAGGSRLRSNESPRRIRSSRRCGGRHVSERCPHVFNNNGSFLLALFEFFIFFAWFMCMFWIFGDLFRSRDLGGGANTLWTLFIIIVPILGTLVYLIARGHGMTERGLQAQAEAQKRQEEYIRSVAAPNAGPGGSADQIASAKSLLDSGAISQGEYEQIKAKALQIPSPR